ncbi:RNase H type-1 domain-containing protein [Pycnococcus provasolii]
MAVTGNLRHHHHHHHLRSASSSPSRTRRRASTTTTKAVALSVFADGSYARTAYSVGVCVLASVEEPRNDDDVSNAGWMLAESRWGRSVEEESTSTYCADEPAFAALGELSAFPSLAGFAPRAHAVETLAVARGLVVAYDLCDSFVGRGETVGTVTIYTDAQSLIKSLDRGGGGKRDDVAIRTMRDVAARLRRRHRCTLRLKWCPGHVGFVGNARAHDLAATARRVVEQKQKPVRGGVGRRRRRRAAKRDVILNDVDVDMNDSDELFARRVTEGTTKYVPSRTFWSTQRKHMRAYEKRCRQERKQKDLSV